MKYIASAFGNMRFRSKLVLSSMIAALIPLLIFSVVIGTILLRDIRTYSGRLTEQLVGQTSESIDVYIGTIEKLMDLMVEKGSNPTDDAFPELEKLADSVLRAYPEIAGCCIAYEDEQFFGAGMVRISRDLFKDEYWWQYALEQDGQLGIIGSAVGRNVVSNLNDSSDSIFTLVKAFPYGALKQKNAVILFDIRHDMIGQLINRVSIGEKGFLFVVDQNDIVYTPASSIVYRIDEASYTGASTATIQINQVDYFVANHDSGYSDWKIVGVIPESEFLNSIRPVYYVLFFCIGICMLLVILVSVSMAQTVTRPLSKLSRLMARVEEGDFSVRFDAMHKDEIGTLAGSFNHMLERIDELIYALYEEKQIRLEAQLKNLQEQIKPHFLYNTLDTISWMARAQNAMDVVHLVDALTNMFRVGLSSGRDYITLAEEKNHVANYLYIQKVRYQDRLNYVIEIPAEYEACVVPKLILQPLVENAIYHGIKLKRSGGTIRITAQAEGDVLYLHVWDDGAGIPPDKLQSLNEKANGSKGKSSFGLSYITERIRLSYGAEYGIRIASQEGEFTEVTVTLPMRRGERDV